MLNLNSCFIALFTETVIEEFSRLWLDLKEYYMINQSIIQFKKFRLLSFSLPEFSKNKWKHTFNFRNKKNLKVCVQNNHGISALFGCNSSEKCLSKLQFQINSNLKIKLCATYQKRKRKSAYSCKINNELNVTGDTDQYIPIPEIIWDKS